MNNKIKVCILVDKDNYQELKKYCNNEGTKIYAIVNKIIKQHLEKEVKK